MIDNYISGDYIFDRKNLNLFKRWWIDIDKINLLLIICIITFGLIMTITASPYVAKKIDVGKFFFVKKQMVFSCFAIIILCIISFLNKEQIKLLSIAGIFSSLILLITVLLFGAEAKGAKRWINMFGFAIQPAEFTKIFFLVFNAFLLEKLSLQQLKNKTNNWLVQYGFSTLLYLIIVTLIISEPDFGMSLIFTLLWLGQLFLFGLPIWLIIFAIFFASIGAVFAYIYLPHVTDRIDRFLSFDSKNYQVERSIDAYINGGFFGTGPGNGLVKRYIPDSHTDFVFAVVGEEFGLIISIMVILIFFFIITRVIKRIALEDDLFSYLAVAGLILQFALQTIINIGVSLRILPTKGMTLPFISYGGSSTIAMAIGFGIILSLTKKKYEDKINYNNIFQSEIS